MGQPGGENVIDRRIRPQITQRARLGKTVMIAGGERPERGESCDAQHVLRVIHKLFTFSKSECNIFVTNRFFA